MDEELNKIDIIRERMDISYREAKEVLEECGGDLIEALAMAEERKNRTWSGKLLETGEEMAAQVGNYIKKGNQTKIKLKRGDKTLVEFPATVGALGILAVLASSELALAAGIGAVAAVAKKVSLEIQKPDGASNVVPLYKNRESKDGDSSKPENSI